MSSKLPQYPAPQDQNPYQAWAPGPQDQNPYPASPGQYPYQGWNPYQPPRRRTSGSAITSLVLGCSSLAFIVIAYIGWALDLLLGPAAFITSICSLVAGVRKRTFRGMALGGLLTSLPAVAWTCYFVVRVLENKSTF
jgi:hypothetical protein